ncbi:hypothetical protein ACFFX1_15120, partial [Dactylosporangium sucinum]
MSASAVAAGALLVGCCCGGGTNLLFFDQPSVPSSDELFPLPPGMDASSPAWRSPTWPAVPRLRRPGDEPGRRRSAEVDGVAVGGGATAF